MEEKFFVLFPLVRSYNLGDSVILMKYCSGFLLEMPTDWHNWHQNCISDLFGISI